MTDRITPEIIERIGSLLNDGREKYKIPPSIRLYIIDTLATQEENLVLVIRQLLTGKRIREQETYEAIIKELYSICDVELSLYTIKRQ